MKPTYVFLNKRYKYANTIMGTVYDIDSIIHEDILTYLHYLQTVITKTECAYVIIIIIRRR